MSLDETSSAVKNVEMDDEQTTRSRWCSIVDSIASMDSTEPLPSSYNKTDYLPDKVEIPHELITALRQMDGKFASESESIFKLQMNFKEGCHAKPSLPHFVSSAKDEVVFSLNNTQGPDFYQSYKNIQSTTPQDKSDLTSTQRRRSSNGGGGDSVGGVNNFYAPTSSSSLLLSRNNYNTHHHKQRRMESEGRREGRGRHQRTSSSSTGSVGLVRMVSSPSRLASGLMDAAYYNSVHRQPDFMPIILVPSSISSPLQLMNIRQFVEHGSYVDPTSLFVDHETGAVYVVDVKPDAVIISPGSFLDRDKYSVAFTQFKVVDDPAKVNNWTHVCACFVDGAEWQFVRWFPDEPSTSCAPSELFNRVRGFLPYFEEDKIPLALQQWRVQPIVLTRRLVKAHQHLLQASIFWEQLYTFLDDHPFFRWYTVRLDD